MGIKLLKIFIDVNFMELGMDLLMSIEVVN